MNDSILTKHIAETLKRLHESKLITLNDTIVTESVAALIVDDLVKMPLRDFIDFINLR